MLKLYKSISYDIKIVANRAVALITGLAVSAMMIIIEGIIISQDVIITSIGALLLFAIIIGTLLSDSIHSSNKYFYYTAVHRAIVKGILIKRGFTDLD